MHLKIVLAIENNNADLNNITFGLISNDNCFMSGCSVQQRTVNTRSMINNNSSNDVQFKYVLKPPLHIMSLLSLHGDGIIPTLKEYAINTGFSRKCTCVQFGNKCLFNNSHNMKEYGITVEPKNVNIIVNVFRAPVNVEKLFGDTRGDGSKTPTV